MKIDIMTLFPQMFSDFTRESIIGKAIEKKIIDINLYNIRDYADNKAHHADDYTYGGGNGMLMLPQPIYDCHKDITKGRYIKTYYLSPKGKLFNQKMAIDMSKLDEIIFLCGHYEGVDERALELIGAEEVSIGDYVLTGGELPCMVIIDSVARFIDGVLSNDESANDESFINNLLEYPQYTRPASYEGLDVPEVLISGDHKKVAEWRLQKSIEITKKNRPDLYKKYIENN